MGEGKFFFYTGLSSLLYSEVHRIAQRIDALPKGAMVRCYRGCEGCGCGWDVRACGCVWVGVHTFLPVNI